MSDIEGLTEDQIARFRLANQIEAGLNFPGLLCEDVESFGELFDQIVTGSKSSEISWLGVCFSGMFRSKIFNSALLKAEVAVPLRKERDRYFPGVDVDQLSADINAGERGLVVPDGFDAGFSRLVLFSRKGNLVNESVSLLGRTLSSVGAEPSRIYIHRVHLNEQEVEKVISQWQ